MLTVSYYRYKNAENSMLWFQQLYFKIEGDLMCF